ncbi:MAG: lactonase family protein [Planctomycetota bacterium]|jgi:6-phosphogluconolactonase (cycloisomerase 2 family)
MKIALILALSAIACSGGGGEPGPVANPPAVSPLPGFATDRILVVASERAAQNLAVLSVDAATGSLGLLPGSPIDLGVPLDDAETLAADSARRRLFFGSSINGAIAVADVDASGRPIPVAGSPFAAELPGVSVIKLNAAGDAIYVGYHDAALISRYTVAANGTLTLAQSFPTGANRHIETMLLRGDTLHVGFAESSNIVGYRLDAQGVLGIEVYSLTTNARPDFLLELGSRIYCSLANDASVDAFDVEVDGSLTRLAGAPYAFAGIAQFELIAAQPGGAHIAVGAEAPSAAIGLYVVQADGSLTPAGAPVVLHDRRGGPEGLTFSADGRFLYVCDHIGEGLYVFELTLSGMAPANPPRYELPGRQIDVLRLDWVVTPP